MTKGLMDLHFLELYWLQKLVPLCVQFSTDILWLWHLQNLTQHRIHSHSYKQESLWTSVTLTQRKTPQSLYSCTLHDSKSRTVWCCCQILFDWVGEPDSLLELICISFDLLKLSFVGYTFLCYRRLLMYFPIHKLEVWLWLGGVLHQGHHSL